VYPLSHFPVRKNLILLIAVGFLWLQSTQAQVVKPCGTSEHDSLRRAVHPEIGTIQDFEHKVGEWVKSKPNDKRNLNQIYKIPVVVHIVHSGGSIGAGDNLSDAQVISQIQVMNEDFRRKTGTRGFSTYPQSADTKIEFELAFRSPTGTSTSGIIRHLGSSFGVGNPPFQKSAIDNTIKPATIWDPTQYFNVWVMQASGLYGYAQFPEASGLQGFTCYGYSTLVFGANTDGVVMAPAAFGSKDLGTFALDNGKEYGKVMSHEIGHWLGLRHIWGDASCGTDYCEDTPTADSYTLGTNTHPSPNSCGTPDEMFENHMDYTDDIQKNTFTIDQMIRMRAVLENSPRRKELLSSPALLAPTLVDAAIETLISPSGDYCSGSSFTPSVSVRNMGSSALTAVGLAWKVDGGATQTVNRTTSISYLQKATLSLNPLSLSAGDHTLKVWTATSNGNTDPASYLDTFEVAFTVTPGLTIPAEEVFETASFPPKNWTINNLNNDCFAWRSQALVSGGQSTGTTAMTLNLYSYTPATGQKDELITPLYNLAGQTLANLYFNYSFARKSSSDNSNLSIFISSDCGATWNATPLLSLSGAQLATTTTQYDSDDFRPSSFNQWSLRNINLATYLGSTIRLKFVTTNNGGNNLYIDNVGITNSTNNVPTILSFSPISGVAGTTVTITGTNLANPSNVNFNGATASVISSTSSQIVVTVPVGASSGAISVFKTLGSATSATNFIVLNPPSILSFSPLSGQAGTVVTVTGSDHNNLTSVKLNGTTATFTPINPNSFSFVVPAGATTGKIQVQNGLGTGLSQNNFLVGNYIVMSSTNQTTCNGVFLDPGGFGNYDNGLNVAQTILPSASGVKLSVTFIAFRTESGSDYLRIYNGTSTASTLIATLSGSSLNLPITYSATNAPGALTFAFSSGGSFVEMGWEANISCYTPAPPTITSFAPASGIRGSIVSITGTNFIGTTSVKFNNIQSPNFNIISANSITATVPNTATTGLIQVSNGLGTATSSSVFVVDTTVIPYCFPTNPSCGSSYISKVEILNSTLNNSTTCNDFNGSAYSLFSNTGSTTAVLKRGRTYVLQVTSGNSQVAAWFDLNRDGIFSTSEYFLISTSSSSGPQSVSIAIPHNAALGFIGMRIRSRSGSFGSGDACGTFGSGETEDYYVKIEQNTSPYIISFNPLFGLPGTVVSVTGANFTGLTALKFNGTAATFNLVSSTLVTATVPAGATTGRISIASSLGTDTSIASFFVGSQPPPSVLIIHSDDATRVADVFNKLTATGAFSQIGLWNGTNSTPTISQLQPYRAVLVYSNSSWLDKNALGNVLTSYIQSGGGVVSAMFNHGSNNLGGQLGGNFIPFELIPFANSYQSGTDLSIGTRYAPTHPLLKDVLTFQGGNSYRPLGNNINPGSVRIADWADGTPLIVARQYTSPTSARKVDLGLWPVSSDGFTGSWASNTNGANIMRNALLWVMGADTMPYITGFDPGIGVANDLVTISGRNLTGTTVVKFNTANATQIVSVSDTLVSARVPAGATTGKISITTPRGTAVSANNFFIGTEVSIFTGSLTLCNGKITDSGGSLGVHGNNENIVFTIFPSISGALTRLNFTKFRTQSCCDRLEIYNGTSTNSSIIGTYQGNIIPPEIMATNIAGALTLRFVSNGSIVDSGFVANVSCFVPPDPQVLGFSPGQGIQGTFVSITGKNFINVTSVAFNGTNAAGYTVVDTNQITTTVPFGASTGKISVQTGSGTGLSTNNFRILDPNFNCIPSHPSCSVGGYISNVSIVGTSLNNLSACNNTTASAYTKYPATGVATCTLSVGASYNLSVTCQNESQIISAWLDFDRDSTFEANEWYQINLNSIIGVPSIVQILVPSNTAPGTIMVRIRSRVAGSPNGSGDACTLFGSGEAEDYTISILPDIYSRIVSFNPSIGFAGDLITIRGKRLQNTSSVKFNQVSSAFTQINDSTLTATVPSAATTGLIIATTPLGVATSNANFVVRRPGRPNILILHSLSAVDVNGLDVKSKLEAVYPFSGVDVINGSQTTPSLTQLQQYDAVLMWNVSTWFDRITLGNNLASYINGGGRVVGGIYATGGSSGSNPGGSYSSFELIPFGSGTSSFNLGMATPTLPAHPLLKEVMTFQGASSGVRPSTTSISAGAIRVANWTTGNPLIVVSNGIGTQLVRKVDLGFCPVSGDVATYGWNSITDGAKILRNALLWVTNNENYIDSNFSISSFNPGFGPVGTPVLVKGKRFTGVSGLKFNGTPATFVVSSDTVISTSVPIGAATGKISAQKGSDLIQSQNNFIVGDTLLMLNGTYSLCGGFIASSKYGSSLGGYSNNEFTTLTLIPSNTGSKIRLSFLNFSTESGFDYLRVYNGTSSGANLLGTFSGSSLPGTITSTNATGVLTLVFSSDGSSISSGFLATISCVNANGPNIASVSPGLGAIGSPVIISGVNLSGATSVKFNGTTASINTNSASTINTTVPGGATSGFITVTTPLGNAQSPFSFVVCSEFTSVPAGSDTVSRCGTGSVSLIASGVPVGSSYRWFSSPTSISYLAQGSTFSTTINATTTYYVAFYNGSTGCLGPRKPVVAKINSLPNAQFSGLQTIYCQNDAPSTLIPGISGGTFTNTVNNQFVPSNSGTFNVTYTVFSGGCTNSSSQITTVRALPNASFIGLKANYCLNEGATTLVPTVSGGAFSGTTLLTGSQFNPSQIGTFIIRYTVVSQGCTNFLEKTAIINPIPNAQFSGLLPVYCQGTPASILLPAISGGAFSGSGVIGNQFIPSVPGQFTVTYTLPGTPCQGKSTATTSVFLTPVASFTSNGMNLSSTTPGTGMNFQWLLNGVSVPNANTSTFLISLSGGYQLVATKGNCSDTSAIQLITETKDLINQSGLFSLYPNPASNWVHIKSNFTNIRSIQIAISNSIGQLIDSDLEILSEKEIRIQLGSLPSGVYFIRLNQNGKNQVFPVRKE